MASNTDGKLNIELSGVVVGPGEVLVIRLNGDTDRTQAIRVLESILPGRYIVCTRDIELFKVQLNEKIADQLIDDMINKGK